MTPEETLQLMAEAYPEIFPTRRLAFNHMFCIIGNGASWIDGELVYDDPAISRARLGNRVITKAVFPHEDDYTDDTFTQYTKWCERRGVPVDPRQASPFFAVDYSDKKYLKLHNYPDNITPEWRVAIEECKEYIRRDGLNPDPE